MRILVLSDIHHRHLRAQSIIDKVPHDKCILLGDYFDAWGDNDLEAKDTAIWLRDFVLPNKKIVPLIGNHDTMYFYSENETFRCSGYTNSKNKFINQVLKEEHKDQFSWYHIESGFLFVHAGLTKSLWKKIREGTHSEDDRENCLELVNDVLKFHIEFGDKEAKRGNPAPLFSPGWDRGGFCPEGGINWVDWNSFAPVKNINQIVGHTRHQVPQILVQQKGGGIFQGPITEFYKSNRKFKNPLSVNYALDTDSSHYMVIEDGVVNIYDAILDTNLKDIGNLAVPESELNNLT
jgi:hypothetical protein